MAHVSEMFVTFMLGTISWGVWTPHVLGQGEEIEVQRFRETPQSVLVSEGEDVELRCAVDNQKGKAQWTKDGFALGFERDVPGYPRYQYKGDPRKGEHNLIITGITLQDDGEYQCQVGPIGAILPIWTGANVTVLVPPSSISIVGWRDGSSVEVLAGASFVLQCLVEDARPLPSIKWFKNGALQTSDNEKTEKLPGRRHRLSSLRSRLLIKPTPEDNGKQFSCRTTHPALEAPPGYISSSVVLSVLHLPDPPIIKGLKAGQILQAGKNQDLTCSVRGGNPRPWVIWYRNGEPVDDSMIYEEKRVINTYRIRLSEKDDNSTLECRVTSDLLETPMTINVTLQVYYPPSFVKIQAPDFARRDEVISLECKSGGSNPASSISWNIDGREMEATSSEVKERPYGGWTTSSVIENLALESLRAGVFQMSIECLAFNSEFSSAVSQIHTVSIVNSPGKPILEGLDGNLVAGKDALVSCASSGGNPPPTISLYKDGSKLTGIPKQSQKGRTTETVTEIDVQASDNNLQVICQVEHPSSGSFLSTSHTMSVLFPPSKIEGRSIPPTVDEGGEVTFTCDAASSNPPVNITWRAGEVLLTGSTQYHIDAEYGGQRTRSQLKLKAKPEFDTTPFTCEASNGLPNSPKANISLNVNHAPIWIVKPPEFIDAKEGDDLVIIVRASAKPGPIKYKWWKDGARLLSQSSPDIQIQDGGGLRFHPVNRAYSSNFSVEVENPRGKIKSYFVLDVLYGPTNLHAPTKVMVNEDSMAVMECSAEGNPKPLITWAKQNRSKALVSGKGIARLFVDQTSPSHSGTYECIATNEIGTVKALPSRLIVKHAPIIMSSEGHSSEFHAHLGRNGRLNCLAKAAPKPTFVWRSPNDVIIQNTTKYSVLGPQLVDGISMWQSTLIIFNVHQNDYMKYKCEIHNMLGVDKGSLVLSPPLIPEAPINLKVVNVTDEGRVTFTWMLPGDLRYHKGRDRAKSVDSYIIRYWEDDQRKYKEMEIPAPKSMMAVISNLAPDRSYYVTISARGEEGQSPFTRPALMVNMPGVMGKASSSNSNHHSATNTNIVGRNTGWRVPRLLLLITTLTGAALLALNIAIIACFVKRRKRERNISVSSSKTTSLGVYYAPQMSNSVEDLEAPGNTPLSPLSATQCQLVSGSEEKRLYVDNQQQFGSSLLLQVDDQIRGSRRSSNLNMSPTTGNPFPCQLEAPRPSIPLDLLEGSNIPLNESPLSFNPAISSFASNSEGSNFIINAASPQNSGRVRELTQNEDQMSPSSQSSSRTRSPKIAPSNDQETGHKSLSEKDIFDSESGLLRLKKTSSKKDKTNNGRSKPGGVAHSPFERQQQPNASPLSHFDQDYGNEAKEAQQNFQANQIGMRTLNHRRTKKDEPRFATLQKPKSSTKGNHSSSLNPEELAYATINIKTSPRHRQAKLKLNPESNNSSPQNSGNSQGDIFPYATSSSVVGFHEIPRYINLRTFRENTAILTPQSQHNEIVGNETQPTNTNDINSINNMNGITIPSQSSDSRTPTIEAVDHTNINVEERPTNLHSSVNDVTHSKMAPDFSEKENILVLKLTNSRPLNSGTNTIA